MSIRFTLSLFFLFSMSAAAQAPMLVYDLYSGQFGSEPCYLTPFKNKLCFIAYDTAHGREMWSYDGSNPPTLVADLYPGKSFGGGAVSENSSLGLLGNKLYFSGNDGVAQGELFVYDGVNPPSLVADLQPTTIVTSAPKDFVTINGTLYFFARASGMGNELYSYDGINTPVVHDINPGAGATFPMQLTEYKGKLYFTGIYDTCGQELLEFDPATDSGRLVMNIDIAGSSHPESFVNAYGSLWFAATTVAMGRELYEYNGTTVTRVTDLAPGRRWGLSSTGVSSIAALAAYNGYIYFGGTTDGSKTQLYRYDPAADSSTLAATIHPTGTSSVRNFQVYNNKLYFYAGDSAHGIELWVTDGTTTSMVADLNPGPGHSMPSNLTVWGNDLFMTASDGLSGKELYRIVGATGITSTRLDGSVKLFPNPAGQEATLEISLNTAQHLQVQLYDMQGRKLWEKATLSYQPGTHQIKLPLQQLTAGAYFYHLSNGSGTPLASGRLIKN